MRYRAAVGSRGIMNAECINNYYIAALAGEEKGGSVL